MNKSDEVDGSSTTSSADGGKQCLKNDSRNQKSVEKTEALCSKSLRNKRKLGKVKASCSTKDNDIDKEDENDGSMCNTTPQNKHTWTEAETLMLLSLYKDYDDCVSKGKLTYRKLWSNISAKMRLKGYEFTPPQISSKMDSLKRSYKCIKDHNAQSGNSPKKCDYYEVNLTKYVQQSNHLFFL